MLIVAVYFIIALFFVTVSLYFFAYQCEKARIINPEELFLIAGLSIIAGFLGARTGYVIIEYGSYIQHPIEILKIWNGGFSSMGAAIAGGLVGLYLLKRDKIKIPGFLDLLSPYLALSIFFTRIGGFMRGSSFGKITTLPWGVVYPKTSLVFKVQMSKGILAPDATHALPVHPTTLYEAASGILAFAVIMILRKKNYKDGTIMATLLLVYFTGRFLIDFLRGDMAPLVLGILTPSQLISIVAVAGSLYFLLLEK